MYCVCLLPHALGVGHLQAFELLCVVHLSTCVDTTLLVPVPVLFSLFYVCPSWTSSRWTRTQRIVFFRPAVTLLQPFCWRDDDEIHRWWMTHPCVQLLPSVLTWLGTLLL